MKTSTRQLELRSARQVLLTVLALLVLTFAANVAIGQSTTITGAVTAETGEALPGVNVTVKGTTLGTATDSEGRYAISVDPRVNTTLIISSLGYGAIEITIGERSVVDVQLTLDVTTLDEVVVTGYYSLLQKNISSSISVVDVDDMTTKAASNIGEQLQGKVPGVQVSTSGGPGSYQYVRIRGIGTINNNEPLYVIDGVPVQNETNLNFLNPNDIESMQVLKDAAAASIYGARAANGVIVITTKRGTGSPKVSVDFFTGLQLPPKFPKMANPLELLEIQKALFKGAGFNFSSPFYIESPTGSGNWVLPDYLVGNRGYTANDPYVDSSQYVLHTGDPDLYHLNRPIAAANKEGTDWFKELYGPAPMTSIQLSASAANEKSSHYLSMNYYHQNGILLKNNWQRLQTRLNNTFSHRNFRIGENLNIAYQSATGSDGINGQANVEDAYKYLPIVPVHDINGYWAAATLYGPVSPNPVADQTRHSDGVEYENFRTTGNMFVEVDFSPALTLKAMAGADYFWQPIEVYNFNCPECARHNDNSLFIDHRTNRNWVTSTTLNFQRSPGKHSINAMAGWEARSSHLQSLNGSGFALKYGDDPHYRELSNSQGGYVVGSQTTNSTMTSFFGNVNYSWNDRYIVAATVRRDGSSKFRNDKHGLFPSASAAWRISEESFASAFAALSEFKLRASYGITGNNEVIGGDYPGYSTYAPSPSMSSYPITGNKDVLVQGFGISSNGNPDLKWETCEVVNIGFDATIINNLSVTAEWYSRKTRDMILGVRLPLETGNVFPFNRNVGSMSNTGVDLQVTYRGKSRSGKLDYTIGIAGTHYQNKVLALEDNATFIPGVSLSPNGPFLTRTQVGYPISQFYGKVTEGLWESQEQIDSVLFAKPGQSKPGRVRFKDVNGDGLISESDKTLIGNPVPKFIVGLSGNVRYRSIDFSFYLSGVFGQSVFNSVKSYTDFSSTDVVFTGPTNKSKRMLDDAGKSLPELDGFDQESGKVSDYFVENASFVRCQSLTLGYTIPGMLASRIRLTSARVYFQAQNAFTLTNYSGLNPDVSVIRMSEGNQPQRDLSTGLDRGAYPVPLTLLIGMGIQF